MLTAQQAKRRKDGITGKILSLASFVLVKFYPSATIPYAKSCFFVNFYVPYDYKGNQKNWDVIITDAHTIPTFRIVSFKSSPDAALIYSKQFSVIAHQMIQWLEFRWLSRVVLKLHLAVTVNVV